VVDAAVEKEFGWTSGGEAPAPHQADYQEIMAWGEAAKDRAETASA